MPPKLNTFLLRCLSIARRILASKSALGQSMHGNMLSGALGQACQRLGKATGHQASVCSKGRARPSDCFVTPYGALGELLPLSLTVPLRQRPHRSHNSDRLCRVVQRFITIDSKDGVLQMRQSGVEILLLLKVSRSVLSLVRINQSACGLRATSKGVSREKKVCFWTIDIRICNLAILCSPPARPIQ